MTQVLQGSFVGTGVRVALVVSRFNEFITSKLLDGAVDALVRHGVEDASVTVIWVPGAFEIPALALKAAESGKYDAVVCLGCVIRGDTPHFDYVAAEVSKGVASVGMDSSVPVVFGVITTESIEQAIERAGTKAGNKGAEAAVNALELVSLYRQM